MSQLFSLIADSIVLNREVKFQKVMKKGNVCQIMVDDLGYTYSNAQVRENGNVRWRCSKKSSKEKCRAYVTTEGSWIVNEIHPHNHPPVEAKLA